MFSHQLYNLVHIIGIILVMAGIGGMAFMSDAAPHSKGRRRLAMIFHGFGIFLILLGGFGMLARIGIVQGTSWPAWVWVKVVIWAGLAASAFLPFRFPRTAVPLLLLLPVLGGIAAYMAIYKPF